MAAHLSASRVEDWLGGLTALAVERVLAWVPPGRAQAVMLSGSVAAGEAVWVSLPEGRRILSDIDLYVVVKSAATQRQARAAARKEIGELGADARRLGLWAPIDVGFYRPEELQALPARPGTIELARLGRCVWGDPSVLARLGGRDTARVSMEEVLLLLENRGYDLLGAWGWLARGGAEGAWRAAHASLKSALDLASVLGLTRGRYAATAADRVVEAEAWLEPMGGPIAGFASRFSNLWAEALAFRRSPWLPAEGSARWWRDAVLAWTLVWLETTREQSGVSECDPYRRVLLVASRARWRRKIRLALEAPVDGVTPPRLGLLRRLATARRGTPQHRLNGCAAALLLSAAEGQGGPPALGPRAARALRAMAPFETVLSCDWEAWLSLVYRAWDRWYQDGQRSAVLP